MIPFITFVFGFITATLIFRSPASAPAQAEPALPVVGTRWSLRGHDGEVFAIRGLGKGSRVFFAHDDGDSQAVPLDYFMAVARPLDGREH